MPEELVPTKVDKPSFSIIHHRNGKDEVTLDNGLKVVRQSKLYVPEWQKWVMVADDPDEFIFENKRKGYVSYQCTCGASAVCISPNSYKQYTSPQAGGDLWICLEYATQGRHLPQRLIK